MGRLASLPATVTHLQQQSPSSENKMAQSSKPAENVYSLKATPPTKEDSDSKGYVLYYKPSHGWFAGYWQAPYLEGVTHWTYLPETPPALPDPGIARDAAFEQWAASFPEEFSETVTSLMRLGWNAAWKRAV